MSSHDNLPPTKTRKEKQREIITLYARSHGIIPDFKDRQSLLDIAMIVLDELGLTAERGEFHIQAQGLDSNGIVSGTQRLPIKSLKGLLGQLAELIRVQQRQGKAYPSTTVDHFMIGRAAARILKSELGSTWLQRIGEETLQQYEDVGGFQKGYRTLTEKVGFKVNGGKIMVAAELGAAHYRNSHITLQKTALPGAVMASLSGKRASEIIDGAPYDNALESAIIAAVSCPDGTTVIELNEELQAASELAVE